MSTHTLLFYLIGTLFGTWAQGDLKLGESHNSPRFSHDVGEYQDEVRSGWNERGWSAISSNSMVYLSQEQKIQGL